MKMGVAVFMAETGEVVKRPTLLGQPRRSIFPLCLRPPADNVAGRTDYDGFCR
jgi:hypothetical protein